MGEGVACCHSFVSYSTLCLSRVISQAHGCMPRASGCGCNFSICCVLAVFHFCPEIPPIQAIRIAMVWVFLGYSKYLYEKCHMFTWDKSCSFLLDRQKLRMLFSRVTKCPWGDLGISMMGPNYVLYYPSNMRRMFIHCPCVTIAYLCAFLLVMWCPFVCLCAWWILACYVVAPC